MTGASRSNKPSVLSIFRISPILKPMPLEPIVSEPHLTHLFDFSRRMDALHSALHTVVQTEVCCRWTNHRTWRLGGIMEEIPPVPSRLFHQVPFLSRWAAIPYFPITYHTGRPAPGYGKGLSSEFWWGSSGQLHPPSNESLCTWMTGKGGETLEAGEVLYRTLLIHL